jgi:hypothetical protein
MPTSPELDFGNYAATKGGDGQNLETSGYSPYRFLINLGPQRALLKAGDNPKEANMKATGTVVAAAIAGLFSIGANAQTTGSEVQRDLNQQQRIEQGLKSGSLNTREASKLEAGESRIDRMESNAMKDGKLSPAEKARIQRAQNQESRDINRLESNAARGNPNSASSQRMQADVQRNVNQQQRIEQGVKSGQLTNREVGKLENGQARVDRAEARAGANGRVSANEQQRIQKAENQQSKRIYKEKHDAKKRH